MAMCSFGLRWGGPSRRVRVAMSDIFPSRMRVAGRDVLRDTLKIVRLETTSRGVRSGFGRHQLRKIGLVERFDARGQRGGRSK